MSNFLLKKYVKTVIEESTFIGVDEVDHMTSISSEEKIALKQFLNTNDLQIVPGGKNHDGVLGRGLYGVVIEVVQGNKHYALKLTQSQEDYDAYAALHAMYNSFPNFVKRSFPKIYRQKLFKGVGVTLMEWLVPPSISLLKAGWGNLLLSVGIEEAPELFDVYKKRKKQFLINFEKHLNDAIDSQLDSSYNEQDKKIIFNDILFSDEFKNSLEQDDPYYLFSTSVRDLISDFKYAGYESYIEIGEVLKAVNKIYNREIKTSEFPVHSYQDNTKESLLDPRLKHLLLSLRWLKKNKFIKDWNDVHDQNVMYRPSTKDLVVADIGLFKF